MRIGMIRALTLALLLSSASASALAPTDTKTAPASSAATGEKKATPSTSNVSSVYMARELWQQGVQAFQEKDYEAARIAFEKCYAFMPKTEVLRNLSISEVESGAYVSAIGHLSLLLATEENLSGEVRNRLDSLLTRSLAQVGQLAITVDIAGSPVWVDGKNVGTAPLDGVWYVKPGRHSVRIKNAAGPDNSRRVYAMAGVSIPVDFVMEVPVSNTVSVSPAVTTMQPGFGQSPPALTDNYSGLSTQATVTVAAGGALTALFLAGATYYTAAAYRHSARAEALALRIQEDLPVGSNCANSPQLVAECRQLLRSSKLDVANSRRASLAFAGFGIAGAATLGYALYLSLGAKKTRVPQVIPLVDVGRTGTTLGFRAQF